MYERGFIKTAPSGTFLPCAADLGRRCTATVPGGKEGRETAVGFSSAFLCRGSINTSTPSTRNRLETGVLHAEYRHARFQRMQDGKGKVMSIRRKSALF